MKEHIQFVYIIKKSLLHEIITTKRNNVLDNNSYKRYKYDCFFKCHY